MESYAIEFSGLKANTKYYVRAYVVTESDTIYGTQQSFTATPTPIVFNPDLSYGTVKDIDGNSYRTIQIGEQVWMAENLRTTHFPDGSAIQLLTALDDPVHGIESVWSTIGPGTKAYCWQWDDITNASTYGALYTWDAAMNGADSSSSSPSGIQGVCPDGWHLPSDSEWTEMINHLGGHDVAGGKLKETGNDHWISPNEGATNESGFTAIASGAAMNQWWTEWWCFFWSTTVIKGGPSHYDWESWDYRIVYWYIQSNDKGIYNSSYEYKIVGPEGGYSVRCVKDPGNK
jgi:uncharacterized protein (TIGR02145 family)